MNQLAILLSRILKIPVDSGVDFETFAEVHYNGQNLGTVSITKTPGNTIIDDNQHSVKSLRWDYVYFQNSEIINQLIATHFEAEQENLEITLGTFRTLYVRNDDGELLGSVSCVYENNQWSIYIP
ncbi:hypothetical protein [Flavobacterium sp.]